jgi:hypothetical protein
VLYQQTESHGFYLTGTLKVVEHCFANATGAKAVTQPMALLQTGEGLDATKAPPLIKASFSRNPFQF